ncbi:MAG: hypothetical protein M4579_005474 [Chaenotheca gracillima]|nr:MAG: hypothetical protein M4579_005474 [Chaenotheca gracillima]
MAPQKRARALTLDEEEEVISVESARSSLREESRKKARMSNDQRRTKSQNAHSDGSVSDESEDSADDNFQTYEERRDAGFRDLEDEDLDTQRATQIIQEKARITMDNMAAENGVIEAVTCINFMCHSKLHVSFGPLINFIIGHNGSGKSAVLTALTLCLGGKASSTNRGQSLKSFIKEGQDSATLIVKIKNQGTSGYQGETFGDSIIVERQFSKAGTSGFKIKSANGRVVSTRRTDLEEITDYFAMQIDNPMNVLTQDMARQFLSNSLPHEKYRFFLKGTQLEQLDVDYQLLGEIIDHMETKLHTQNEDLLALKQVAKEAAGKLAMSDKHNSLRDQRRSCARQMAWAQVEEQERALSSVTEAVVEAEQRIEESEVDARSSEVKFDQATQAAVIAADGMREVAEELVPLQDSRKAAKESFDKNKGELIAHQAEERSIRDHLKAAQQKISKTNADIEAEQDRITAATGGMHARKLEEIEELRRRASEARTRLDDHATSGRSLEDERRAAELEVKNVQQPLENKKQEVKQSETQLSTLIKDKGQRQDAFHENMPRLLRAIRDHAGFRDAPVGPVGNHVRLLKPVWSSVLERSFGATLTSFIVTSKKDQALLSEIMRKVKCVCPILIGNNHPIDIRENEPDSRFDTSLRVLEIDNELVKRQLIINQGIEQTILIEDREEANRVMFESMKPRNVKQCFCLHDTKRGWGVRLGYTRGVEASTSPMPPMNGAPRMKTDIESQISFQRGSIQALQHELNELVQKINDQQSIARSRGQDITRHQRQGRDLQLEYERAEERAARMQDELEQDNAEDGRLEALRAGLQEAEEDVRVHRGSFEDSIAAKDRLNAIARSLRAQLQGIDGEIAEHEAKRKKAEAKQLKASNIRQSTLQEKNAAFQKVEDKKGDKERITQRRDAAAERVREFTEKASQVCERVPVGRAETVDSLEKKYERFSKDLERYQQQMGDTRETIAEKARDTRLAYETAKGQVQDMTHLDAVLKDSLNERCNRWRKFRKFISARARAQFMYLLSERSFRGLLKTDHKLRSLELHVEPDETRTGKGRQTKTLSGGEKSFSTICLLLALWEAMGSPIRCLDEFDVFMDNVNRDVSLKMMINAARRSVGRQYILITPQSMGNVDVAPDVKIIKLSDPERGGQTTLPFGTH